MKLFIGNKNYSSWSYRVWLTLKVKGIDFSEDLRPFDVENDYADYAEFSPTLKVPVLLDEDETVWESLSILEYIAEKFPDAGLWPKGRKARAIARSLSNEMHAGFLALRAACPMNMRRKIEPIPLDQAIKKDIARVEQIWTECLEAYGGPFLMGGEFTIVDGMFAPVVNRFQIYELSQAPAVRAYSKTLTSLDPWKEWVVASEKEPWVVDIDEVYA
ncbi:MAG: glutathione S-transferase family protein [Pseudomonadota bacterium]